MKELLRRRAHVSVPLLIGVSGLWIGLDGLIVIYRRIGLDRGTAIYVAVLTFSGVAYGLTQRYFRRRPIRAEGESDTVGEEIR